LKANRSDRGCGNGSELLPMDPLDQPDAWSILSLGKETSTPFEHATHNWQQPVTGDHFAEEDLVLYLDSGHVQQVVDAILHFQVSCKNGCVLVFDRVFTLKPPGKIPSPCNPAFTQSRIAAHKCKIPLRISASLRQTFSLASIKSEIRKP